jgi:serine/threonine-protein kinase RsbW
MFPKKIGLVLASRIQWLDAVQGLGENLAATVGFDEDGRFAVGMALREGLNNAILHGNRKDESKLVEVTFLIHEDRLEIRVKDEGRGFDKGKLPDPLAEENRLKSSGRGVFLIKSFMDEVDLERASQQGGEVRMSKWLPGKRPGGARPGPSAGGRGSGA